MSIGIGALNPIQYSVLKLVSCNDNEPIKGKILLQKLAFLIFLNFPKIFEESLFQKHKLGPYSAIVDKVSVELQNIKLIEKKQNEFICNDEGNKAIEEFEEKIDKIDQIRRFNDICQRMKEDFNDFSQTEILAFIYREFPDYREHSVVESELNYVSIFQKMYIDGKLGISKIAELLDLSVEETYQLLEK